MRMYLYNLSNELNKSQNYEISHIIKIICDFSKLVWKNFGIFLNILYFSCKNVNRIVN